MLRRTILYLLTSIVFIFSFNLCADATEVVKDIVVEYNPVDATDNIANAIIQAKANPGKERIILSNDGNANTTWISEPIYLGSNMELYIEADVTLKAKSGSFMESQPFININEKSNVTVRGEDRKTSKISMRADEGEYTSGEHKHCVSIAGGINILVSELTLEKSGGDGLCISDMELINFELTKQKNNNVRAENLILNENARNGISIISGNNIYVNNCKVVNTGVYADYGCADAGPWAGLSIEPEDSRNLNNITISNCYVENQDNGSGIDLALKKLVKTDELSIDISNCKITGCYYGIIASRMYAGSKGKVNIENCVVQDLCNATVVVREWNNTSAELNFKNCAFINPIGSGYGVINFRDTTTDVNKNTTGNVKLDNIFVFNDRSTDKAGYILYYDNLSGCIFPGPVSGNIKYNNFNKGKIGSYSPLTDENKNTVTFSLDFLTSQSSFLNQIGFVGYTD